MIVNGKITKADLYITNDFLEVMILIDIGSGFYSFGGRVLGRRIDSNTYEDCSAKGIEEIMRIMDVVGVSRFTDMIGEYVRVDIAEEKKMSKIGNIIKDKWFDYKEFYGH